MTSASTELPAPDDDARAHSERVAALIRGGIVAAGGWMSFARYMERALYAPGLGYYAAGAAKLGAAGDFTTAPEMTPLFAGALAVQVDAILAATARREIVELGGGSGRLAAKLLNALDERGAMPSRYAILETSPDLRERQRIVVARDAGAHLSRVEWLDALPSAIDGAVIANEVLDAVPVHVVSRRGGQWLESGVVNAAASSGDAGAAQFAWADRPANGALKDLAAARFPAGGDYRSEINPAAEALVAEIGHRLAGGAALFIDYGFPAAEYYHPQRSTGTLMCHYRHRAHDNPFLLPGLTDITAHVDFSAMASAGVRAGLAVAGYAAQAPFLLGCDILDLLSKAGEPGTAAYVQESVAVQQLLSPAEMGELFKVLALERSDGIAWPGFTLAEHSHRL